jgi:hypothetical protein
MADIVAIETAKAREQAERLFARGVAEVVEEIVTALLEAKADTLEEHAPDAGAHGGMYPHSSYARLLRESVNARRARGL